MEIKGILFDLYGTLIDIETDESLDEIYRGIGHFLTYQGIDMRRGEVRDRYWEILRRQKRESTEEHPEIDVEAIWDKLLLDTGLRSAPARKRLALTLTQMFRGISRKRLRLYPDVREVLDGLKAHYRLGLVSDAQPAFALPEIKAVGLDGYFDPIIISAPHGYRKPDPRMWREALGLMKLKPSEAIYVGNDMFRDIFGAELAGLKTIFIDSNQGAKSFENTVPHYFVQCFEEVPRAIEALSTVGGRHSPAQEEKRR